MQPYKHVVKYYETDKMGVAHHSNYIRWMEEARVDFFNQIGWSYKSFEEKGIFSPVVSLECKFTKTTTFDDEVFISLAVEEATAVRFKMRYTMTYSNGITVCQAKSEHCFVGADGKILRIDRLCPEFFNELKNMVTK